MGRAVSFGACNYCGKEKPRGYWCDECRDTMTDEDKWYLIGFLGLALRPHPNGMTDETPDGAAFIMGERDRIGNGTN